LHMFPSYVLFQCTRFLVWIYFATVLIEFTAFRGAKRLTTNTGVSVVGNLPTPVWLGQVETAKRIILTQWVCGPVVGHQNTTQIRMSCKGEAEQVIDLTLIPIRPKPNSRNCRQSWMLL